MNENQPGYMKEFEFRAAADAARPGERICYGVGNLAAEAPGRVELLRLRYLTHFYYSTGKGFLTQRRRADLKDAFGCASFQYYFTKSGAAADG